MIFNSSFEKINSWTLLLFWTTAASIVGGTIAYIVYDKQNMEMLKQQERDKNNESKKEEEQESSSKINEQIQEIYVENDHQISELKFSDDISENEEPEKNPIKYKIKLEIDQNIFDWKKHNLKIISIEHKNTWTVNYSRILTFFSNNKGQESQMTQSSYLNSNIKTEITHNNKDIHHHQFLNYQKN